MKAYKLYVSHMICLVQLTDVPTPFTLREPPPHRRIVGIRDTDRL